VEPYLEDLLNSPSGLARTWFFDLDGTLLMHNGNLKSADQLLPGVAEFFQKLPLEDVVIITTARNDFQRAQTLKFLDDNGIRYDLAIFDLPVGERIVVNDIKPRGLRTAIAVNVVRDKGLLY
jgi:hypothetical protein